MSHLGQVMRLIEMGYCSYPGGGIDLVAADSAVADAIRLDFRESPEEDV